VSYWSAYLKAHHPLEFAAATLDAESDPARQIALLRELAEEGIDYVPIDPERSGALWEPAYKGNSRYLIGPLTNIKGIGPAFVDEIIKARTYNTPLRETLAKKLQGAKTPIDTLWPVRDRIKALYPDLKTARNITTEPTPAALIQAGHDPYDPVLIIGVAKRIVPRDENEPVRVAARKEAGKEEFLYPSAYLNLFMIDDTDEIFCKIGRKDFEEIGRPIMERGRAGRALYAILGVCPLREARMIWVTRVKYLGDMEEDVELVREAAE
jgi:hypothetical protein